MRLGILGAGQLGRMLALAARPLDIECIFFDPAESACAVDVGKRLRADYDDRAVLDAFAAACDVVTLEFENVPVTAVTHLAAQRPVHPGHKALATAQDRLLEKQLFSALEIPVADYYRVDDIGDMQAAGERLGRPLMLKTRRMGYDGKGQMVVQQDDDLADCLDAFSGQALIAERLVAFEREVSVIAVRSRNGESAFYPLSENLHRQGILCEARPVHDAALTAQAHDYAHRVMQALDYVGVMAFEFFVEQGGVLLANEIAPRVHNSGHWTIEGARCSQFENHVRAVCGLPLGSADGVGESVMFNLIGALPPLHEVLAIPGAHAHFYGKSPRPGRKVGHVTLTADSSDALSAPAEAMRTLAERYNRFA